LDYIQHGARVRHLTPRTSRTEKCGRVFAGYLHGKRLRPPHVMSGPPQEGLMAALTAPSTYLVTRVLVIATGHPRHARPYKGTYLDLDYIPQTSRGILGVYAVE
jgi:hypothetical protein